MELPTNDNKRGMTRKPNFDGLCPCGIENPCRRGGALSPCTRVAVLNISISRSALYEFFFFLFEFMSSLIARCKESRFSRSSVWRQHAFKTEKASVCSTHPKLFSLRLHPNRVDETVARLIRTRAAIIYTHLICHRWHGRNRQHVWIHLTRTND